MNKFIENFYKLTYGTISFMLFKKCNFLRHICIEAKSDISSRIFVLETTQN